MGCCLIRDEKFARDKGSIVLDFTRKGSNNNSDTNLVATLQDKGALSIEVAKSFFKQKSPTIENNMPNLGMMGSSSDMLKSEAPGSDMTKKDKIIREDEEFLDKINHEEEKKDGKESSKFFRDRDIVTMPRLELSIMNTRLNNATTEKIIMTPNSINGSVRKIGDKFLFGRTASVGTGLNPYIQGGIQGMMPKFSSSSLNHRPNDYDFSDDSIGPRQFEISYSKEKNKFYVVDNKRGTGLFVKIKQSVVVDHDMIVSFCASHMILQVESELYHPENKIIKIRFLQGPHQNQEKVFNSKDKKIIRIGRSKQAEVVYKDDSVSRIQCTIVFEKGNWNLYDGYLDNGNKGSTNGLWLLASSKIEITNEMTLKTGNTAMAVKLFEQE